MTPHLGQEQRAARMALIGIVAGAALASVKILAGLAAGSVAVISDGLESASDCFTSGLVYLGLRVAAKPADQEHPYGHGRFEILTGLAMGAILAAIGAMICVSALEQRQEERRPATFAIWVVLGAIVAKGTLAAAKMRVGKRTHSEALTADAWHDWMDMLSGIVALASVSMAIFVPGFHRADHWGGFAIGVIVIFLGLRVARDTALQLMDTMPGPEQMEQIRAAALRVPGALAVEKCFARKTGLRYHVDLHLEVDPAMTVLASHEIATEVRFRIREELDWVADVLVHVEPHLAPAVSTGKAQELLSRR
ncbi:MAG TPA: cation diffusion facilitator family transporter [Bryobacteraceae bacterium]|nr:cation diffusion facilitator family transporter [Bryobacteraceae bacterium]